MAKVLRAETKDDQGRHLILHRTLAPGNGTYIAFTMLNEDSYFIECEGLARVLIKPDQSLTITVK